MTKRVFKYGTGDEVPKDAEYLCTLKNGQIKGEPEGTEFVWHYFLVYGKDAGAKDES